MVSRAAEFCTKTDWGTTCNDDSPDICFTSLFSLLDGNRKALERMQLEYVEKHHWREKERLAVIGPILVSYMKS